MPRGGSRPGAGRKLGSVSKLSREKRDNWARSTAMDQAKSVAASIEVIKATRVS
jgi:hypothetical protein